MEPAVEEAVMAYEGEVVVIVGDSVGAAQEAVVDVGDFGLDAELVGMLEVVDALAMWSELVVISGPPEGADVGTIVPEVCEGIGEEIAAHPDPSAMPRSGPCWTCLMSRRSPSLRYDLFIPRL
ncbi:hypothetical protein Nepgr_024069 [Nepenthes gracilis]|uniref:Uncharacterized protein n=1 Tax=Nepenthes gracilis TaxID=150966 RepID=A0AAD3T406_NEPGR|nr:hypothetical protein Nepgr_024069 [Nepenthes gracilis]